MNNNSALSSIFTKNSLNALIQDEKTSTLNYIVRKYNIALSDECTNEEVISEIYQYIDENYRNEYFYKNTVLNKLIINVHKVRSTTALTEIPISKSIADIIMINGKAVVYEIKTELDSFERLDSQISDYYKAFDHVCVITSESKLNALIKHLGDSPVGIYVLTKRGSIKRVKEPVEYKGDLCNETIFKILNKHEYENIIQQIGQELPNVTPVNYYKKCKEILCHVDISKLYVMFLKELKKRNHIENIDFSSIPYALRFLVYFSKFNNSKIDSLNEFLNQSFLED